MKTAAADRVNVCEGGQLIAAGQIADAAVALGIRLTPVLDLTLETLPLAANARGTLAIVRAGRACAAAAYTARRTECAGAVKARLAGGPVGVDRTLALRGAGGNDAQIRDALRVGTAGLTTGCLATS